MNRILKCYGVVSCFFILQKQKLIKILFVMHLLWIDFIEYNVIILIVADSCKKLSKWFYKSGRMKGSKTNNIIIHVIRIWSDFLTVSLYVFVFPVVVSSVIYNRVMRSHFLLIDIKVLSNRSVFIPFHCIIGVLYKTPNCDDSLCFHLFLPNISCLNNPGQNTDSSWIQNKKTNSCIDKRKMNNYLSDISKMNKRS